MAQLPHNYFKPLTPLIHYTYHIIVPEKQKRIEVANELRALIGRENTNTFIPGNQDQVYKADIGINGNVIDLKMLGKIEAFAQRRGYKIFKKQHNKEV